MVSGAMSCVKYLIFLFNLLFAICGIAVLVIGAISQTVYQQYHNFVHDKLMFVPITLIVVGVAIFIIAFFGCCGAVKENHCMITTFATFLLIIFVLELAAAVAAYVYRNDIGHFFDDKMNEAMKQYDTNEIIKHDFDILQYDLRCCGVKGYKDWTDMGHSIPNSCCANTSTEDVCTVANVYDRGCWNTLEELLSNNALIIGGVAIGVAFIQLIGVVLACCLSRSIQKDYETV